ncbi:MAG: rhomboid family intramembrane serine protease [Halobacteria archaeon]|nr:rhomboid family intramembrane serine protease [Halobacteria archaeon]
MRGDKKRRYKIIGTLYLILVLILIYQIEFLITNWFGYTSVECMLKSVLLTESVFKSIIVVFFGPFLHTTASHLVDNLGLLILAGGYVEYKLDLKKLYGIYIIAGWFGLLVAKVIAIPAVGASASVAGLEANAAMLSLYYFCLNVYRISRDEERIFNRKWFHVIPLLWFVPKTIGYFTRLNLQDGTSTSHVFGSLMGLIIIIGGYLIWNSNLSTKY